MGRSSLIAGAIVLLSVASEGLTSLFYSKIVNSGDLTEYSDSVFYKDIGVYLCLFSLVVVVNVAFSGAIAVTCLLFSLGVVIFRFRMCMYVCGGGGWI